MGADPASACFFWCYIAMHIPKEDTLSRGFLWVHTILNVCPEASSALCMVGPLPARLWFLLCPASQFENKRLDIWTALHRLVVHDAKPLPLSHPRHYHFVQRGHHFGDIQIFVRRRYYRRMSVPRTVAFWNV